VPTVTFYGLGKVAILSSHSGTLAMMQSSKCPTSTVHVHDLPLECHYLGCNNKKTNGPTAMSCGPFAKGI